MALFEDLAETKSIKMSSISQNPDNFDGKLHFSIRRLPNQLDAQIEECAATIMELLESPVRPTLKIGRGRARVGVGVRANGRGSGGVGRRSGTKTEKLLPENILSVGQIQREFYLFLNRMTRVKPGFFSKKPI